MGPGVIGLKKRRWGGKNGIILLKRELLEGGNWLIMVLKYYLNFQNCTNSIALLVVAYAKYNSSFWRNNEVQLYVPNQYIHYVLRIWFHKQSAHGWRWDQIWNTRQTLSWLQVSAKQCLTLQCLSPFDLPDCWYFWKEYFKFVDVPLFLFFFLSFPESPKAPGQGLHGGETCILAGSTSDLLRLGYFAISSKKQKKYICVKDFLFLFWLLWSLTASNWGQPLFCLAVK